MIRITPLVAIVVGCVICTILNALAALCPGRARAPCFTLANAINCGLCIFVIYVLLTAQVTFSGASRVRL